MQETPVRLLLVDLSRSLGLAERTLWELATRLPRERYSVKVWLAADPSADGLAEALEARGAGVDRFGDPVSRWDPRAPFQLWLKLRRERPRLVHVHHAGGPGSLRVARAAAADGVPLVLTRHALGLSDLPVEARRVYERADQVVAVTRATAEQLVGDWRLARSRVRWIPYGTTLVAEDSERAAVRAWRDHLGARPLRPLWVCPLRLDPGRGLEALIDAAAEVRRRELDFVLAFPGDGPLRPELERRAAGRGIAASVIFPEVEDTVDALLGAADAVLFPMPEGPLPLSLLDAMARARPVVASASAAVSDVIEDGIHGRLLPAGDTAGLAEALESFHRRPDSAMRLGRAAEKRVREAFSWDRVVSGYEDAYDEALGFASFVRGSDVR